MKFDTIFFFFSTRFMMENITSELGKGEVYPKTQILSLMQLEEKIL
jgi:hypothetical protein